MSEWVCRLIAALTLSGVTVVTVSAQSDAREGVRVAETPTSFPGSFWVNSGYVSPLEAGNLLTTYAFEQGWTIARRGPHSVSPFASLSFAHDRDGLDWNNKTVTQVGLKYARTFRNGVMQVGAAYAYERRLRSSFSTAQPTAFASYWFGWNPDPGGAGRPGRGPSLPGTSWASVGNHAPAEGNNVIATIYVQQGVTILGLTNGLSVIPFIEHTLTVDSAGHTWNNRRIFGEGIKVRVPVGPGVLETAAVYKHERRWQNRQSADGLTASVNLWYGWNPSKRVKE